MADQGASQSRSTGQTRTNQAQTMDPLPGAGEYFRAVATLDSHDLTTFVKRTAARAALTGSPETPNSGTYFTLSAELVGHDLPSDPSRASAALSERLASSPETPNSGRYFKLTVPITPIGGTTTAALTTYYLLRAYDITCPTPTSATWVGTAISYAGAPTPPCGGSYGPITVLVTWRA